MNYPFDRKYSLSRALSLTMVVAVTVTALAGCDLLPSSGTEATTEATSATEITETETTEAPTTETTVPVTEASRENIAVVKEQLNVRSSPSTGSRVITELDAGDEVEVLRIEPIGTVEWAYVSSDSLNMMGWIVTDMLDMSNVTLSSGTTATPANTDSTEGTTGSGNIATAPTATTSSTTATVNAITGSGASTSSGQKGVVLASDLNIRSSASTNGDRVGSYNYGDRITILETSNGWGRTDKGWVSLSYVYIDGNVGTNTATATVTASQLNVRSGPGTGYDKVTALNQGDKINILEQVTIGTTSWGYASGGWICMDYVSVDGAGTTASTSTAVTGGTTTVSSGSTGTVIATGGLNARETAGTTGTVVGGYKYGETVTILETTTVGTSQWGRTSLGWICLDYVRMN